MDSRQAKEILRLYRPAVSDPDDREMAEALALARQDAELGHWLEQHLATQAALREKFRAAPVPEGLREQILSERVVGPTLIKRVRVWRVALAVAAVLMLLGAASLWRRDSEDLSFTGFRQRMVQKVLRQYPNMDLETNDLKQIKQFLAEKGQGGYVLPEALEKTAALGCGLLTWQGRPVTMICFKSGAASTTSGPDLFLFITSDVKLRNTPEPGHADITPISRLSTASWTRNGKVYVLGSLSQQEELRKLRL